MLPDNNNSNNKKPIFVATHPRACSTAFERVFMTRRDILDCVHEPFGDAYYFGPERLSDRYENDPEGRQKSGFAETTYRDVLDQLQSKVSNPDKRVFIKDIAHYLFPPNGKPASPAPSLVDADNDENAGNSEKPGTTSNGITSCANGTKHAVNPTVIPTDLLRKFHFTFLIRHPRRSIPSYYRCTVPPLSEVTGFHNFMPDEAGYEELRGLFDYLKDERIIGSSPQEVGNITVLDADDLLDNPEGAIRAYCDAVGIDFHPGMLRWEDEENQKHAVEAFQKWNGFHDDVIGSTYLKPREHAVKQKTTEQEDAEWREKYGEKGQTVIRECVNANIPHYEYLKSFALQL
ncbi:P-loop containing nucleoside triphosphate hydrolase protein [Diplogelasinospora grovesii]|uniref:P-loop containing nucleoside triphosphate hydrolase protein n=1 Tax=Diplogelasinospora grovesii TaxID=303347 RepID=A0AAN6N7E6_9PEZI|nr:P-loop containing nucleoside triphosphate hydrolase protein [Diplogelasinospora grovesii]